MRHPTAGKSPWLSAARRVRPIWGLGLAGATALALVVASMAGAPEADRVLPPVQPSAPSLHLRQVANAEDLANNAAVLAAEEPDSTPRPTQWAYMKSKVVQPQVDGGSGLFGTPKVTHTREMWRRADEK
ncbi:hypothetical protein [Nonomuraea sp. NPDC046570]|uniref:hypothetical protein n=1 Tax=Nonomuraea sp. NPDC046570 TaxID=3155255 RepID=UPI003401F997